METPNIQTLYNRIRYLNQKIQQLWCAIIIIAGIMVSGFMILWISNTGQHSMLRSRGLILMDESGRERILLGVSVPSTASVQNENRKEGLLILGEDGTHLVYLGKDAVTDSVGLYLCEQSKIR